MDADLAAARLDYTRGGLAEGDLEVDPIAMFERWYADAVTAGLHEPNAMVVATVGADGRPSSRTVLLKGVGPDGFVFYTNLDSRKGRELATHPYAALLFPWHPLERQVRVEGPAVPLSRTEVADYFTARPRASQIGAWASHQSRVVASREELEQAYAAAEQRFDGQAVPVPDEWGGFRVRPDVVEFWQGRTGRMHDRLVYRREGSGADAGWVTHRLAP